MLGRGKEGKRQVAALTLRPWLCRTVIWSRRLAFTPSTRSRSASFASAICSAVSLNPANSSCTPQSPTLH